MSKRNLKFEDAMLRARLGAAIAREGKDYYFKLFLDARPTLYIGILSKPDDPLKPMMFMREPSVMAEDWYVVEGK